MSKPSRWVREIHDVQDGSGDDLAPEYADEVFQFAVPLLAGLTEHWIEIDEGVSGWLVTQVLPHSVHEDSILPKGCSLAETWIVAQKDDWGIPSPHKRFRKNALDLQKAIRAGLKVEGPHERRIIWQNVWWAGRQAIPGVFVHVSPPRGVGASWSSPRRIPHTSLSDAAMRTDPSEQLLMEV